MNLLISSQREQHSLDFHQNGLRVVEMDFRTDPQWESFVRSHSDGLIFHHPAWLQALEHEYGQKCIGLACVDAAGGLHGVLPLMRTSGLPFNRGDHLTGRRLSSLPRTPIAGPLSKSQEANACLVTEALRRVQSEPGLQLELKMKRPLDLDSIGSLSEVEWRTSYMLEIPDKVESLRFGGGARHRKLKWAINKAEKHGLVTREAGDEADLRRWHDLYLERMRHNVVPARPYRFFESLWHLLRPQRLMRLVLVESAKPNQREIIAGSIFLLYKQTVTYAFNGSRVADLRLCPNDVLQWHHIHQACKEGYRWYDFGEVPHARAGLAAFKAKWNAVAFPLHRYYFPAPFIKDAKQKTRIAQRVVGAIWKNLPLATTAALSDRVYRYL